MSEARWRKEKKRIQKAERAIAEAERIIAKNMPLARQRRIVDQELLKTVSKLWCVCCPPPSDEDRQWIVDNIDQAPRRCDPHHVISRGASGDDIPENVVPLCIEHHQEIHRIGAVSLAGKYRGFSRWLDGAGMLEMIIRAKRRLEGAPG